MKIEHWLAPQLGHNWMDRTVRGRGNRAARRAICTNQGKQHLRDINEDIYTERPDTLNRGAALISIDDPRNILPRQRCIELANGLF